MLIFASTNNKIINRNVLYQNEFKKIFFFKGRWKRRQDRTFGC